MRIFTVLVGSIVALATLGALVSLSSLFSRHHILFDLISHFRMQYIVLLLPAFLIAIYTKKTISVLIISFALAIHGYAVTMSLLPVSTKNDTPYAELTVLNSNLLIDNTNYQAQIDIIEANQPHLIAFQEYTPEWDAALSSQLTNYPHRIIEPSNGSFGIALYSKYPIIDGGISLFSTKSIPSIQADIQVDNTKLHVMAVHPPPPSQSKLYWIRNQIMRNIALESQSKNGALLVMGDFNATPWTAHFSDMTSTGKLRNARAGHGFHPTWPTPFFWLGIPIDHILVNAKIGVEHFEAIHLEGSDHRNILSRLRIY